MILWDPAPAEELAQNVRFIMAVELGSLPLARSLGLPQDLVDQPQNAVGGTLREAAIDQLATWEPRVKAKKVKLTGNEDGRLGVTVEIG